MFYVGQKVVCIWDDYASRKDMGTLQWLERTPHTPVKDLVYTVRTYEPDGGNIIGIRVNEIVNPSSTFYGSNAEPQFAPWLFLPIVEKKTDISIFTKMLTERKEHV